jgi:hypothetical protein
VEVEVEMFLILMRALFLEGNSKNLRRLQFLAVKEKTMMNASFSSELKIRVSV